MPPPKKIKDPSASSSNRRRQMNGWECSFEIASKLITSGYGVFLIAGGVLVSLVWVVFGGMESPDKKDAFLAILNWPGFSFGGWILAGLTLAAARFLHKLQRESYERQIQALRESRNEALGYSAELPLDTHSSPNK